MGAWEGEAVRAAVRAEIQAELNRLQEMGEPCPDCGAEANEPCHVDCSSNWTEIEETGQVNAQEALDAIHEVMDGQEWDSDTLNAVAEILSVAGYTTRDAFEVETGQ